MDKLSSGAGNVCDDYVRKSNFSWRILTAMRPYYPTNCNARVINVTQAVMCDISNQCEDVRSGLEVEWYELTLGWYLYISVVDIRIGL